MQRSLHGSGNWSRQRAILFDVKLEQNFDFRANFSWDAVPVIVKLPFRRGTIRKFVEKLLYFGTHLSTSPQKTTLTRRLTTLYSVIAGCLKI